MLLMFFQTGESSSPSLEVKVEHRGNLDFRVEADGMNMDVNLAVYSKVKFHVLFFL